jgi:hypothetical protein
LIPAREMKNEAGAAGIAISHSSSAHVPRRPRLYLSPGFQPVIQAETPGTHNSQR